MTELETVSVYIAANILILIWLSVRVMLRRFKGRVSMGDGGSDEMAAAIRTHANAAENTPAMLIGLLALAFLSSPIWVLHVLGGSFTLGRLLHPIGMALSGPIILRQLGMVLTWTAMILLVGALIYFALV